jgi:NAD(P)-dependent dehydrogenase (short-subunit alcohol dehydrogenase family)
LFLQAIKLLLIFKREKGLSVSFIQVDITQEAEVQSMVRRVLDLWGHLDILINMVNIPENIDLRDTFAQQSIQYLKQIERQLA